VGIRNVSNSKSDLQGHWHWCHLIGHIRFPIRHAQQPCLYLALFPRYYQLFHKISRGHLTLNTSHLAVIYHACSSTPLYQSAHIIEVPCFTNSNDIIVAKFKKMGHLTRPRPRLEYAIFYLHTKCGDSPFSHSGDMIAGIEIKNGSFYPNHAPFKGGFVMHRLGFDTFYLCAKFDDSGLNRARDIIVGPKI